MKIYFAGSAGFSLKRESNWHKLIHTRLLSFYDMLIEDVHYVKKAFEMIKELKDENIFGIYSKS